MQIFIRSRPIGGSHIIREAKTFTAGYLFYYSAEEVSHFLYKIESSRKWDTDNYYCAIYIYRRPTNGQHTFITIRLEKKFEFQSKVKVVEEEEEMSERNVLKRGRKI